MPPERLAEAGVEGHTDDLLRTIMRPCWSLLFILFVVEMILGTEFKALPLGVGIVGLAFTLATQDGLENLLGAGTIHAGSLFGAGQLVGFLNYVAIVREGLSESDAILDDSAPRVAFHEMAAYSLDLAVMYFHASTDWWEAKERDTDVNLEVMKRLEAAGIELAFPTQTPHVDATTEGATGEAFGGQPPPSRPKRSEPTEESRDAAAD